MESPGGLVLRARNARAIMCEPHSRPPNKCRNSMFLFIFVIILIIIIGPSPSGWHVLAGILLRSGRHALQRLIAA